MEPEVGCSTHELETGVNGPWEGVEREELWSLGLGRGGTLDLPHNNRKVSKRVCSDLQSWGGLADGAPMCRKSEIKLIWLSTFRTSGLVVSA